MLGILDKVWNFGKTPMHRAISLFFFFQLKKDLLKFQDHHTGYGDVISISLFLLTLSTLKPLNA